MFAWRSFDALPPRELHDVLKLRADVFVVEQACVFERDLPVVFVHVEEATLRSRMNGRFCFVDGGGNAVKVKDAGKDKAAGACTDNCDVISHVALL